MTRKEEIDAHIKEQKELYAKYDSEISLLKENGQCYCESLENKKNVYNSDNKHKIICEFCFLKTEYEFDYSFSRKKDIEEKLFE